jgi:hypothetical protein
MGGVREDAVTDALADPQQHQRVAWPAASPAENPGW